MLPPGAPHFPVGAPPPGVTGGPPAFVPASGVPPPSASPPGSLPPPSGAPGLGARPQSIPPTGQQASSVPAKPPIPNPTLKQENPEIKKGQLLKYADANYSPVSFSAVDAVCILICSYRRRIVHMTLSTTCRPRMHKRRRNHEGKSGPAQKISCNYVRTSSVTFAIVSVCHLLVE